MRAQDGCASSAEHMSARVFVSCGQREGAEREAALKIGRVLEDLGFEYYIAVNEATLVGLKENIFRQLEEAE